MRQNTEKYVAHLNKVGRTPISYQPPPPIHLHTNSPYEILTLFNFTGITYANTPASNYAIDVFKFAREWVLNNDIERISFDYDHTLNNYLIVENIPAIIKARLYRNYLPHKIASHKMIALEVVRPYMHELALGMMFGFALKQNLQTFKQWENYIPKVSIVTLTWPERIAALSRYYIPLLSMMEGTFPGNEAIYQNIMSNRTHAILHLHHFLAYANSILNNKNANEFTQLTGPTKYDLLQFLDIGKIHHCKPLGALRAHGMLGKNHVHFDDCQRIVKGFNQYKYDNLYGIWVRQSQSNRDNIREINKIFIPAFWQSRAKSRYNIIRKLSQKEAKRSTISAIINALASLNTEKQPINKAIDNHQTALKTRTQLPPGISFNFSETPTTVGDFWTYYLKPNFELEAKFTAFRNHLNAQQEAYERSRIA